MFSRAVIRSVQSVGSRACIARSFHVSAGLRASQQAQKSGLGNSTQAGGKSVTYEETKPNKKMSADAKDVDTTGTLADLNAKIGGILGLAGAPTFTRGENVIKVITTDHRKVESVYDEYKNTNDVKKKQQCAWDITKMLVQHSEVEQMIVYPLLKMRSVPGGQEQHDHSLAEHQEIRELLYALDQTSIDDPSHPAKLKAVMDAVTAHVKEEESEVLPALAQKYSAEELERAGSAFETHKLTAPTRPHPSAPMQGPLAAAAGMAAKPLDLARDALRKVTEAK